MIMTIKREVFGMRGECLLKIQMKIEEKNVCKFRTIMNTFSIDENFKRGGSGHSENEKKI